MKRLFTLLVVWIILMGDLQAQIVEEYRSPVGRRPPAGLTAQIDGYAPIRDVNGNGHPDVAMIYRDSLFIRDGLTGQIILRWKVEEGENIIGDKFHNRPQGLNYQEIEWTYMVGYSQDRNNPHINLYQIQDNGTDHRYDNMYFIGIADFDRGGKPEILAYDIANRQTVILGYENADFHREEPESQFRTPPTNSVNYQLGLKFESDGKRELISRGDPLDANRKYDLDGDGRPELVMFVENDSSETIGIVIRNPVNDNQVWQYAYDTEYLDEMQSRFHGFFDINGDGQQELLFGKRTVVTLDKTVHEVDADFELLMIQDIDNDGYRDLLGKNVLDSTVQVWGKTVSTSIATSPEAEQYQFKVFPNPFSEVANFDFTLPTSAKVRLDIIDATGKVQAVVLEQSFDAGHHVLPWNPDFRSNGLFYARLTVDQEVSLYPIFQIQ